MSVYVNVSLYIYTSLPLSMTASYVCQPNLLHYRISCLIWYSNSISLDLKLPCVDISGLNLQTHHIESLRVERSSYIRYRLPTYKPIPYTPIPYKPTIYVLRHICTKSLINLFLYWPRSIFTKSQICQGTYKLFPQYTHFPYLLLAHIYKKNSISI